MYIHLCLYSYRCAPRSGNAAFSSLHHFRAAQSASSICPHRRWWVPSFLGCGALVLHCGCSICSPCFVLLLSAAHSSALVLQECQACDSHQVFHLQSDRNEMEGETEELFKQRAACDSLSFWGVSRAFLRIPVDFSRSSTALIRLFDYSSQGKPFNSTFWQTELFLAFHCSALSAAPLHCLVSEQAALKSQLPHPQVKREFQMISLVLKFGRVSWARITKGIDLCSQ